VSIEQVDGATQNERRTTTRECFMRVTMLGTGTGVPVPHRGYAGLLLEIGGERVLCDAGPGTLRQLTKTGNSYLDLNRLFVTHAHPDHSLDVVSILFAMRMPGAPRRRPFHIYGPRGLQRLIRRLNVAFHGWLAAETYRLTIHEMGQASFTCGRYRVVTRRMEHSTEAIGYRFTSGRRVVVYSGDTDTGGGIVELAAGADLLILECSTTDERKVKGHLTPTECGRIAAKAGVGHLVLTHFYPVFQGYDIRARVRRAFRGRLTLAKDFHTFAP